MSISKKASRRRTWPEREAATKQNAAGNAARQKTKSRAAKQTESARAAARSRTRAIQAHTQARGKRNQARRDSR